MNFNLSDNKVISLLFVALVLQVLLLLWHMEIIGQHDNFNGTSQGEEAGKIETVVNSLKRRPLDSLIWEVSAAPEKVYFHDSILTLSESKAKITLNNGTQINLSENTLITIEPPEEGRPSEIRIQFSQGSLQARNPYKKATIKEKDVTLHIPEKSDIEISKSKKGDLEIVVNEGEAKVLKDNQTIDLKQNQILSVTQGKVKKENIDTQIKWEEPNYNRYYTHNEQKEFDLKWTGLASQLKVLDQEGKIKSIDLNQDMQDKVFNLPLGSYKFNLIGLSGSSRPIKVDVWSAPSIQLIQPLPRDRLKRGDIEFIWRPDQNFKSYEVIFKGRSDTKVIQSDLNKKVIPLNKEEDYQWGVRGIDEQGFIIPPKYTQPLYIRENPFAPPKLNKPKLLEQPQKTSWLEYLLFNKALAQTKKQALFSWEKIPGADVYYLEVSEDKNFNTTIVKEKLTTNQFIWEKLDDKKTYYWRVAAGTQAGRMGLFTEPTLVELVIPKKKTPAKPKVSRQIPKPRLKPKPEVIEPEVVKAPEPIAKKPLAKEREGSCLTGGSLLWMPQWEYRNYTENGNTKANLDGFNFASIGVSIGCRWSETTSLNLMGYFQTNTYSPKPKEDFPFQPDLQTTKVVMELLRNQHERLFNYGLYFGYLPIVQRVSFEEVGVEQVFHGGLLATYDRRFVWFKLHSSLGVIGSGEQWGGYTGHSFITSIYWDYLVWGIRGEAHYLFGDNENSLMFDLSFILGIEF